MAGRGCIPRMFCVRVCKTRRRRAIHFLKLLTGVRGPFFCTHSVPGKASPPSPVDWEILVVPEKPVI
jgi:hypothetical protein